MDDNGYDDRDKKQGGEINHGPDPCSDYIHLTESWRRILGPGTGAGNWHCDNKLQVSISSTRIVLDKVIANHKDDIFRRSGIVLRARLAPSWRTRGLVLAGRSAAPAGSALTSSIILVSSNNK